MEFNYRKAFKRVLSGTKTTNFLFDKLSLFIWIKITSLQYWRFCKRFNIDNCFFVCLIQLSRDNERSKRNNPTTSSSSSSGNTSRSKETKKTAKENGGAFSSSNNTSNSINLMSDSKVSNVFNVGEWHWETVY